MGADCSCSAPHLFEVEQSQVGEQRDHKGTIVRLLGDEIIHEAQRRESWKTCKWLELLERVKLIIGEHERL